MGEYSKNYKWLRLLNLYTGKLYQNRDAMDEMHDFAPGWMLAFGNIMCEELNDAIERAGVRDSFLIRQIKEKFGKLVIYHNQPRNSEIDVICRKFSLISQFICQRCGRPDVPLVFSAWIRAMDEPCYIKTEHISHEKSDYAELTKESQSEIPDKMIWEEFERYDEENKKAIYKRFEVDISGTVAKIRAHWEGRVANGTHIIEKSKLDRAYTIDEVREELNRIIEEDFTDDE